MEESILISIKKLLGIDEEDSSFDTDIIMHINTALVVLNDIGYGTDPYVISGDSDTWSDLLGDSEAKLSNVKTWLYARVRLDFDPPSSSSAQAALERLRDEQEFRIQLRVDI